MKPLLPNKNRIVAKLSIIFALLLGVNQVNAQVLLTESFDGTTFVPVGWTDVLTSGGNTWTRVTAGTFPTQAPHSGAGEAKFNSWDVNGGVRSIVTPVLSFAAAGTKQVSFWMYRDNGYLSTADKVDVLINTSTSVVGATTLGTINRAINLAPIVAANGWYQYTFTVSPTFSSATNYVFFRATSAYGNNIFIDDISISNNWVPAANNCGIDYISNVTFSSINRSSACDVFSPYATPNPTLTIGSTYTLSVSTGGDTEGARAWIDYNGDGLFNNAVGTELVLGPAYAGTNPATYTIAVTIPALATPGVTRLRARCNYATAPVDATSPQTWGETEDYFVTIAPTGTVGPTAPPNDLCANAITLAIPSTTAGTTVNATLEAPAPPTCITTLGQPGVWYKVVGNGNRLGADLCTTSAWDSKIFVYTGTCGSWSCVTGNDDGGPLCGGAAASATWCSVPGVTYHILATGFSGPSAFNIAITQTVVAQPTVVVSASSTSICAGASATLTASGASTYLWGGALGTTAAITVSPTTTTIYTVTGTGGTCSTPNVNTITVSVQICCTAPSLVTVAPSTLCAGSTATLNATATGASINWYTVPSGGTSLGTSLSTVNFLTIPTTTTTYYAESFILGGATTQSLSYTGGMQTYTVPSGVTSLTIDATGGKGGTGSTGTGGNGGRIQTVIAVTPGQVLNVYVGGAGGNLNNIAGYNGGANSLGSYASNVGGGGGASDIRIGGVALSNRVVVAGGGGGAGYNGCTENGGAGGGLIGASGTLGCGTTAAGGGSQVAGGAGGTYSGYTAANPGTLGIGGTGASGTGGAGGGGGYYGGGGGSWQGGAGGSSFSTGTGTSHTQGFQAGNGYVYITAAGIGCVSSVRTPITVNTNPTPTLTVNSGAICSGQSFTMIPSGASTYTYSGGSAVVTPTTNISYTVTGTSAVGCAASNTVVSSVTVNASPIVTVNSGSICNGSSFTMIPAGASTYTYSSGSAVVAPTTNTSYTVTGTNAAGCVGSSGAVSSVVVNALPVVTVNSGSICNGSSFTMIPAGASTYTYSSGLAVVAPTTNTSYTVTGTSVVGCTNTAVSSVVVNALPVVTVNSGAICSGKSFTMVPSGASTYTYSGGSSVVSPLTNTSYTVTGTSAAGCVGSSGAVSSVTVNANPIVTVSSGSICNGSSFTMIPGGASTYIYSSGSAVVAPTANTSYTVTGTSVAGCTNTAVSSVTVNANPVVTVNSGAICSGASFTMVPAGASTYVYTGGTAVVSPTANTSYTVIGTNAAGCTADAVSSLTVNALPILSVTSGSICSGNSFTMVPTGATTYTYSGGSAVVSPSVTTSYTVSGSNAAGCIGNVVNTITVSASPVLSATSSNTLICLGGSAILTASTTAATSTYTWSSGATTMSTSVTPTVLTVYTVNVKDSITTCVASASLTVDVSPCTGINEILANAISIYPNPNNGIVTINLTAELVQNSSLEVYDAIGKLIIKQDLANQLNTINISNLDNGIYTFKVLNNLNTVKIGKLIKQ